MKKVTNKLVSLWQSIRIVFRDIKNKCKDYFLFGRKVNWASRQRLEEIFLFVTSEFISKKDVKRCMRRRGYRRYEVSWLVNQALVKRVIRQNDNMLISNRDRFI